MEDTWEVLYEQAGGMEKNEKHLVVSLLVRKVPEEKDKTYPQSILPKAFYQILQPSDVRSPHK